MTMVWMPTGRMNPWRAASSDVIVASPVRPPAASPLGIMKASVAKAAIAQPAKMSGRS